MRLLRLTTRQPTANFEATYNSDIVLKPQSRIALQSVSIDSDPVGVIITATNNEIRYQINSSYQRTIILTKRSYTTISIDELLNDIQEKLNQSCFFDQTNPALNSRKILGLEWKVSRDDQNKVRIEYNRGQPELYAENYEFKGTDFTALSATNRQFFLSATDATSSANFDRNAILNFPMVKGCGYLRCRTRRLDHTAQTKQGYIIGVYKDGDMTNDDIDFSKIVYGIRVNTDGNNVGTGQKFYKPIINGVEGATTTMDFYNAESRNNEFQEIAINGGKVELNIYRSNTDVPVSLTSENLIYNPDDNLRPVFVFFGSKGTTQVDAVRFTPSPFHDPVNPLVSDPNGDVHESGLTVPPAPKANSASDTDQNELFFNSPIVSTFLGYEFQRIPIIDFKEAGNQCIYQALRQFNIVQEADAMLVQLINLQVESYDSYNDEITFGNGQRTNILSIIPSTSQTARIIYEPSYPTFLDLNNENPIYLRNLHIRVLREDYSDININGLATIVVLID